MSGRRVRNDTHSSGPTLEVGTRFPKSLSRTTKPGHRFLEPKAQVLRKSEAGLEVLPSAARFADSACDEGDEVEDEMSPAPDAFRDEVPMRL